MANPSLSDVIAKLNELSTRFTAIEQQQMLQGQQLASVLTQCAMINTGIALLNSEVGGCSAQLANLETEHSTLGGNVNDLSRMLSDTQAAVINLSLPQS